MRQLLAVFALTLVVLSGCSLLFPPAREALAVQRDGSDLLVAVCGDIEATHLAMEERNLSEGDEWVTFWERDSFAVKSGEVLSTAEGAFPGAGDTLKVAPRMLPGDMIRITITRAGPEGGIIGASQQFYVPDGGLSQRAWLLPNGTEAPQPCAGE